VIDFSQETLVAIAEVPRLLPPRANGKRIHISACYRWLSRGVKGIVLESVKIGGSTYTSKEALQRFAYQLSGKADPTPRPPISESRRKEIEKAQHEVQEILGLKSEEGRD